MILFFNVLVTDTRASSGGQNRVDRLDLFKYALASYAVLPQITEVLIYCQLDGSYKIREAELRDYISALFPSRPVRYHSFSPANQIEWRDILDSSGLLNTQKPILYMGNDDHVFVDYDVDMISEGLSLMETAPDDHINSVHISSWPESVSTVYNLHDYTREKRHWHTPMLYSDACQIVNRTFFRHVFFDLAMGGSYMRRTDPFLTNWYPHLGDYAFESKTEHPPVNKWLPLREQVRHFDAYWHVNVPFTSCPQLDIPPGFFDGKIRIDYCGENSPPPGYYPWGPFRDAGEQKMIEDIPLFWRSRIDDVIDHSGRYPRAELLAARNNAHKRMMTTPHDRAFQRTDLCKHPKIKDHFHKIPNDQTLPLDEDALAVGYRTS